jgi:large subunit ribosomal protein L25
MNVVNLKGAVRNDFGKQATRDSRREGKIPCVIYGGDEVIHFSVDGPDSKPLVYTSDFNVVEIEIDGKTYKTVIKDIQFHPVTENVEHIDFQELVDGRKVKVFIPVKLTGSSIGVKDGGSLVTVMRKLLVKAAPEHLVSEIEGDITKLNLNQSICVRDMKIPAGIEILQDPGSPVGSVEVPRALKSAESAADLGGDPLQDAPEEGAEDAAE